MTRFRVIKCKLGTPLSTSAGRSRSSDLIADTSSFSFFTLGRYQVLRASYAHAQLRKYMHNYVTM